MKYSIASSFARLTLALFLAVLLLTVAGRALTMSGAASACASWPYCLPGGPLGWLKMLHLGLAGLASILMVVLLLKVWREHRQDSVLLPLTTITAVLFFGQVLVGAVQVIRGFPLHLLVLHLFTAISLWIALTALMLLSGQLERDGIAERRPGLRTRLRDFFALTKPLIVALLLVTTLAGLVAGGPGPLPPLPCGLYWVAPLQRAVPLPSINTSIASWTRRCSGRRSARSQPAA